MNFNDLIKNTAARVAQNETLRKLLQAPYDLLYYKPQQRKYLRNFHTYGLEVLKQFTDCLDAHQRPWFMFAGSMLGAIRHNCILVYIGDFRFIHKKSIGTTILCITNEDAINGLRTYFHLFRCWNSHFGKTPPHS